MKKVIIALLMMVFSNSAFSASYTVNNITKDGGIFFSPGVNVFNGKCSYNWGGLPDYRFEEFMQGATSYSVDTYSVQGRETCINFQVDIVPYKIDVSFVNQEAFAASSTPPRFDGAEVTVAATETVGNVFSVKESEISNYRGFSEVSAGVRGSSNYFVCYVETKSLLYTWMEQAGFFSNSLTKGYIYSLSWRGRHIGGRDSKGCALKGLYFKPALLIAPPPPPAPDPTPVNCPVGCIAAP